MAFLAKALQAAVSSGLSTSTADVSAKPELLGSIRVAVVGEPCVGKTALTEVRVVFAGAPVSGPCVVAAGAACAATPPPPAAR
jgi:hypothetical protein